MSNLELYTEFSSLPNDLKQQVQDFIQFLKLKQKKQPSLKQREFGSAKGFFKMNSNFDDPIEDFKDYM